MWLLACPRARVAYRWPSTQLRDSIGTLSHVNAEGGSTDQRSRFDVVIVGGGIVGLATVWSVSRRFGDVSILVIDKEPELGRHQTGRNSGVIHSGIYYVPGSLKAELCRRGVADMLAFARERGIDHRITGKVIVATDPSEFDRLDRLAERAVAHGLEHHVIGPSELREIEPHAAGLRAIRVPSTGIIDYVQVLHHLRTDLEAAGGEVRLGVACESIRQHAGGHVVGTSVGAIEAGFVINCAGLHSDRIALGAGHDPGARIVPFRGEYFELVPRAHDLVQGLIYPVPDPSFPFLGVHLTSMIHGGVHAGPNAVLALRREGYRKRDVNIRDAFESITYPGFLRLARKHWRAGSHEVFRSMSTRLFTRSLQRLVPDIERSDLVPSAAGVRAQALTRSGALVDDFLIIDGGSSLHVCNAPSPAATASFAIGQEIADRFATATGR